LLYPILLMSETVFPPTNFSVRAVALAIDFFLLAVLHIFLSFFLAAGVIPEILLLEPLTVLSICFLFLGVSTAIFVFLHVVYFTVFHAWTGQTIGKMVMGIKVVSNSNGSIPPSVAFLRWTGYILSAIPLAAGFLWSAVDKDHCAWHDRLAETRVIAIEMT